MTQIKHTQEAGNFFRIVSALVIFSVIISAFFSFSVLVKAEGWSALTPKMILRVNFTEEKVVTNKIGVKNLENVSAQVKLELKGALENITVLEEDNFTLSPEEEKWVNFTVKLPKPGTYIGEILSVFSAEGKQSTGLSSQIIIFATGEEVKSDEAKAESSNSITGKAISILSNPTASTVIISLLLILFIIVLIIYSKKKNKR